MSDERAPISWGLLAAELEAARRAADQRGDGDQGEDPAAWDAVAAELAARVARRPGTPEQAHPLAVVPGDELPQSDAGQAAPGAVAAAPVGTGPAVAAADAGEPPAEGEAPAEGGAPGPDAPVGDVDPETLRGRLEALLFVLADPVDEPTLTTALRSPLPEVRGALAALAAEYDRRKAGITLRRVGEGWRLYTREEHAEVVERYLAEGSRGRLTQAALETLAVIAYRQPVTRARIAAIRGVGVDGVMRSLLARGLVAEVGTDPDSGGGLYATTPLFLERLGLSGLDELPELAPLLPDLSAVLDEHPDA